MGLHKSYDRDFFLIQGNVMTSGRSLQLARGQFGIFDMKQTNKDGAKAISSFKGLPNDREFELRVGTTDLPVTRSQSNKSMSSFPFKLSDIEKLTVSYPENTEQKVDEVIIGYNGIDDSTAITISKGDKNKFMVNLKGEMISLLGYGEYGVDIPVYMDSEECYPYDPNDCIDCDPCSAEETKDLVLKAIETLKEHQLRGGTLVKDYIDVSPVKECTTPESPALVETPYDFYTLTICDTGDQSALSLVEAQYPDYSVVRISRSGADSVYQMVLPQSAGAPADYDQTIASIIKGCEDCPAGYTEVTGGILYVVTLEDEGVDESATVETLVNAVPGSAIKADGQIGGVGYYTVLLTASLSDTDFDTFITANPTATVKEVGAIEAICENSTVTSTSWVVGETCNLTSRPYEITLPDDECGNDRLLELQEAYPDFTVTMEQASVITITGTSGTATVTVDGQNYTMTFNTDIATTISDFQTAEAANILADTGYVLTSDTTTITLTGQSELSAGEVSIANASGDLDGSLVLSNVDAKACQNKYRVNAESNLVCDECDPIFKEAYSTESPEPYELSEWTLVSPDTEESGCKMGIKIKGKILEVHPDECLRDEIGFSDSSVLVQVSGGYLTEVREGIGQVSDSPFHTEYLSRFERRTHLGGNLFDFEDRNRRFFTGEDRHIGDNVAKFFKGEESFLESNKQYISYRLVVRQSGFSQSFSQRGDSTTAYNIYAEVGRHQALEDLLNSLATSANVSPVQALAK